MSADDCIFCKIIAGQVPSEKIYEDEVIYSFLDIGPISTGHTLVIPKQHFEFLHDCPAEVLAEVGKRLGKIAKAVSAAMASDGYNVLCNNGTSAGQLVAHVHFHIIPRNAGDSVFNRWPAFEYEDGKLSELGAKIREKIS